jgi:hypothetical protein
MKTMGGNTNYKQKKWTKTKKKFSEVKTQRFSKHTRSRISPVKREMQIKS